MTHGHDIDGMLAGDGASVYHLRLHLDLRHGERITGWDFAHLHAFHQELHGARLAEIEAAANLIAERLAAAEPAGNDLSDEELAEWERVVQHRCHNIARHGYGPGCPCHPTIPTPCEECYAVEVLSRKVAYSELERQRGEDADAIARGAELARAFNAAGRPEMSGDAHLPDSAPRSGGAS